MIQLYNTLARKKEPLEPRDGKQIEMFVCGPTVYDVSHIGHARTYIVYDAFVKFLRAEGYQVFYLQNITDIDDKIIKRAEEEQGNWSELARRYEGEYLEDMAALGVDSITRYARATDYVPQIIEQVRTLVDKGYGYTIEGDGIYFDIAAFEEYGKLSGRTAEQAEDAVSRIDETSGKRNTGDFCLWKFSKEGEPQWDSPWGAGRPGWHIEDTAITETFFGPQYDVHGGGIDLLFPHHEAEVAQMEAASGVAPLAHYWMHAGMLTVDGQKMAKSEGNYITIRGFLEHRPPELLRYHTLRSLWRSPLDFTEENLRESAAGLDTMHDFLHRVREKGNQSSVSDPQATTGATRESRDAVFAALEDDFNTPKAIAALFDYIRTVNSLLQRQEFSAGDAQHVFGLFREVNAIFGIIDFDALDRITDVPEHIHKMVELREEHRRNNNWSEADSIREMIEEEGYTIEDTPEGPRVKELRTE